MSIQSNTQHHKYPVEYQREAINNGVQDGYGGYSRDEAYLGSLVRANQNAAVEAYQAAYARGLGQRLAEQARAAAEVFTLQSLKPSRRAANRSGSRKAGDR